MERFRDKLLGNPGRFSFENRVFNFITLLAAGMTTLVVLMNLIFGWLLVWDVVFTGYWLAMYALARFGGHFKIVSIVTVGVLVFAFLPYIWLSSGGSQTAIPYYTIVFAAAIGVVVRGHWRLFFTLSMMAVIQGLMIHEAGSLAGAFRVPYLSVSISLFLMIGGMALLIAVYSDTYVKEKERSEAYARTIEDQVRQQVYYMENLDEVIDKLKSDRHDFNNHLGVIYGLLENKDPGRAADYAKALIKSAEKYRNLVNIPYPMLRAMLNYKLSSAEEAGIRLRLNVRLPQGLDLNEIDTTVILGNLLDNAIEACSSLEEGERYLLMELTYKPDYLVIRVENPMEGTVREVDGLFLSSKSDCENHGFGLRNIARLVDRHHGLMEIVPKEGLFTVKIALLVN